MYNIFVGQSRPYLDATGIPRTGVSVSLDNYANIRTIPQNSGTVIISLDSIFTLKEINQVLNDGSFNLFNPFDIPVIPISSGNIYRRRHYSANLTSPYFPPVNYIRSNDTGITDFNPEKHLLNRPSGSKLFNCIGLKNPLIFGGYGRNFHDPSSIVGDPKNSTTWKIGPLYTQANNSVTQLFDIENLRGYPNSTGLNTLCTIGGTHNYGYFFTSRTSTPILAVGISGVLGNTTAVYYGTGTCEFFSRNYTGFNIVGAGNLARASLYISTKTKGSLSFNHASLQFTMISGSYTGSGFSYETPFPWIPNKINTLYLAHFDMTGVPTPPTIIDLYPTGSG